MTTLYRAFNQAGRLLYVGVTDNLAQRKEAHRCSSPWAKLAERWTTEAFATRAAALAAERAAIRSEHPIYNISGRPLATVPRQAVEARYGSRSWDRSQHEAALLTPLYGPPDDDLLRRLTLVDIAPAELDVDRCGPGDRLGGGHRSASGAVGLPDDAPPLPGPALDLLRGLDFPAGNAQDGGGVIPLPDAAGLEIRCRGAGGPSPLDARRPPSPTSAAVSHTDRPERNRRDHGPG